MPIGIHFVVNPDRTETDLGTDVENPLNPLPGWGTP